MANVAQTLHLEGELASRLISRAPRLLLYLLWVLVGFRAAFLLIDLAGLKPLTPFDATPPAAAAPRKIVDVAAIQRASLFGRSAPAAGTTEAPVTSMPLHLAGTLPYSGDEKRGGAWIGTSVADAKYYPVGSAIPGGALLHAIQADRVLLDRGGSIESLLIPVRTGPGQLPPAPAPMVITPAASVSRVQQVMRENPNFLRQVMSPTPQIVDGKLRGLKVYPGPNAAAFAKLGLKSGDVVTAINGALLDDRTRADEIFNSLATAAEARITVDRNGTRQELHLNLAEVANEAERLAQQPQPGPPLPGEAPGPEIAR